MKRFCFLMGVALLLASCTGSRKMLKVDIRNTPAEKTDSVEYELIVFDPGFESWFVSNSKPVWYHSQQYYETWNQQYVSAWNAKAIAPLSNRYFDSTIDYYPDVDYGLELNHKLFYYFQYVEKVQKINILPPGSGPHAVF